MLNDTEKVLAIALFNVTGRIQLKDICEIYGGIYWRQSNGWDIMLHATSRRRGYTAPPKMATRGGILDWHNSRLASVDGNLLGLA